MSLLLQSIETGKLLTYEKSVINIVIELKKPVLDIGVGSKGLYSTPYQNQNQITESECNKIKINAAIELGGL